MLARQEDERTALHALQAGACGFLSKEVDLEALPRALAGVVDGEAAVSRRVERALIEAVRTQPQGLYGLRPVKGPLTTARVGGRRPARARAHAPTTSPTAS